MTEELLVISKEDFEQFAYQMIVTFPYMPGGIRDEWIKRIDKVRTNKLNIFATTNQHTFEDLVNAAQEFVDRCDKGEVRSTYTYNKFKEILSRVIV